MILRFSFSAKSVFLAFFKSWREIVFPPFCVYCKERCETKLFCPSCWALCAPPDPIGKCPHCFVDSEGLCRHCVKGPQLAFTGAYVFEETEPSRILTKQSADMIAAFALHAWVSFDWPIPELVIPMPGAKALAFAFSEMIGRPVANIFSHNQDLRCDIDAIDADQTILILNVESSLEECSQAIRQLIGASPRRGHLLSLFPSTCDWNNQQDRIQ